ncbi:OmpA family protein [Roseospira visakhapatnamensis]|uniref:Outer membrane protein OmpA-like peptidoglycan-associated protein n=1 Tax=Roseospira visakhapatnamensis TaxID=390880 RepID=A0A7W6W9L8_9PROT|nr:OmpA family protein [Roseospira visakhapatnamensis]MBB4265592.1 outer membrane protein OmpA-like peptidoglycan-associated protein [Roseospira visakhapatnamensis]
MMKKVIIAVAAAGLLSACANRWDVDGARSMENVGGPFHAALQTEYADLAASEANEGDWPDTAYFVAKAKAAAMGESVAPTAMEERDLPAKYVDELAAARNDLMGALGQGVADSNPTVAARAQAMFDCWMQEAEEDRQPDDIAACRQGFMDAMNQFGTPAMPTPFMVYFDLDSSTLDAESMATLDAVASDYQQVVPPRVLVVGHTDTSGSFDYNIVLSERRAESVARALAARGIASEVMRLEAYGEERLMVPTADGVVERQNRRVEVMFQN